MDRPEPTLDDLKRDYAKALAVIAEQQSKLDEERRFRAEILADVKALQATVAALRASIPA